MNLYSLEAAHTEAELRELFFQKASDVVPAKEPSWEGARFEKFKARTPAASGSMFEVLIRKWAAWAGLHVEDRRSSDHDMIIGRRRIEVKGSTLDSMGWFHFNQIRQDEFDLAVLVGLTPDDCSMWVEDGDALRSVAQWEMHRAGRRNMKLKVRPGWLGPESDGSLSRALERLADAP
jgi:hypothetical protein